MLLGLICAPRGTPGSSGFQVLCAWGHWSSGTRMIIISLPKHLLSEDLFKGQCVDKAKQDNFRLCLFCDIKKFWLLKFSTVTQGWGGKHHGSGQQAVTFKWASFIYDFKIFLTFCSWKVVHFLKHTGWAHCWCCLCCAMCGSSHRHGPRSA